MHTQLLLSHKAADPRADIPFWEQMCERDHIPFNMRRETRIVLDGNVKIIKKIFRFCTNKNFNIIIKMV